MGSFQFFLKNKDLESLCKYILTNRFAAYKCVLILRSDPNWIEKNYCGEVSEQLLINLVIESYKKKWLRLLLVAIIDAVSAISITDKVFDKLVKFPVSDTQEAIIVSLCHKNLSERQLLMLCEIGTEFECYFELAHLYYKSSEHSLNILRNFFDKLRTEKFGYMYKVVLQELINYSETFDEEKKKWVMNELESIRTGDGSLS